MLFALAATQYEVARLIVLAIAVLLISLYLVSKMRKANSSANSKDTIDLSALRRDELAKYVLHEIEVATEDYTQDAEISFSPDIGRRIRGRNGISAINTLVAMAGKGTVVSTEKIDGSFKLEFRVNKDLQ